MVKTEYFKTMGDGVKLYRTYSDNNKKLIRNDGVVYDEAVDVEGIGYTYIESEEDIETEEPEEI